MYILKAIVEDALEGSDEESTGEAVKDESMDAVGICPDTEDEWLPKAEHQCAHCLRKQKGHRK